MQKGYSHEAMSLSLGFSRVSYSNIESGKTKLGLRRLYQIAHILNVCPSDFLKEETGEEKAADIECIKCSFYKEKEILYQHRKESFEEALRSKDRTIANLEQHRDRLIMQSRAFE